MLVLGITALIVANADDEQLELLKTFRDEFVQVSPGEGEFPPAFSMVDPGDAEAKPRQVTIQRPFAMARYEVPQNLWEAVMGENPSRWKGPRNSVEMLSHAEAVAFCQKATTLMREAELIAADEEIRLPSEAEWEYAARAGTSTAYSFGDDIKKLNDYAWHTGNAAGNDPPVGAKKPNAWGLYDMHGYLWEWCADAWHPSYEGAPTDGSAWQKDGDPKRHVMRGGSWKDTGDKMTSGHRESAASTTRDDAIGLRCVLAKTAPKSP